MRKIFFKELLFNSLIINEILLILIRLLIVLMWAHAESNRQRIYLDKNGFVLYYEFPLPLCALVKGARPSRAGL